MQVNGKMQKCGIRRGPSVLPNPVAFAVPVSAYVSFKVQYPVLCLSKNVLA